MGGVAIGAVAGAIAGGAAQGAGLIGGTMLGAVLTGASLGASIGGVLDPPKPPGTHDSKDSPTYGFNVPTSSLDPWAPVQLVYGFPRTSGAVLRLNLRQQGNHHKERIWMLLGLGEGPVGKSDSNIVDYIEVNGEATANQSMTNKWSVSNLGSIGSADEEVPIGMKLTGIVRSGTETQTPIDDFLMVENSEPIGIPLTKEDGEYVYTTKRKIESFGFAIDCPNGLIRYREGETSMHEDPVRFRVMVKYRVHGTTAWKFVQGPKDYNEDAYGETGAPDIYSYFHSWVDAVKDTFEPGSALNYTPSGVTKWLFGAWDESKTPLHFYWDIKDFPDVPLSTVDTKYRKKGDKLPLDYYDISIARISEDIDGELVGKVYNDTELKYINEITYDTLNSPHTALIGITGMSTKRLNGRIPTISYRQYGRRVFTYLPDTAYTSENDREWSDNPVWCMADIITSSRFGTGQWYPRSSLDPISWTAAANYQDDIVKNQDGSSEKRGRFDYVIDRTMRLTDVLSRISIISGVLPFITNGKWKLVIDKDDDAVQSFNVDGSSPNIVRTSFEMSQLSISKKVNMLEVTFQNEDRNLDVDTILVEDRVSLDRGDEIRRESMELFGVTRPNHAMRIASRLLLDNRLNDEMYGWTSPIGAVTSEAGDIVTLTNADYGITAQKCRIMSLSYTDDYKIRIVARKHNANVYSDSTEIISYGSSYVAGGTSGSSSATSSSIPNCTFNLEEIEVG